MDDFKKMVEESDGPMDLKAQRGSRLFDLDEEPSLAGMSDKLIRAANVIVDHKIAIALGFEANPNSIFFNQPEVEWILARVEPMLKTVQQTKKIQAEGMADVTKMLANGKISINEAKQIMELVAQKDTMALLDELK